MKYKTGNFSQLGREIWRDENIDKTSMYAKHLYTALTECEQRYTNMDSDCFYRADKDLSEMCQMGQTKLRSVKKELSDAGYIKYWIGHFTTPEGKKSVKPITYYQILK